MTLTHYIYRVSGIDKMQDLKDIMSRFLDDQVEDGILIWARKHGLKADTICERYDVAELISDANEQLSDDPNAVTKFGAWDNVFSFKQGIQFNLEDLQVSYPALTRPEDYYVVLEWDYY